jgi:hypothetical protein
MNAFHDPLDRLLKSAAQAPPRPVGELPFTVQTRVLAHWRGGVDEDAGVDILAVFRRGLVLAGALSVLTVAVSWWQMHRAPADVWEVSDPVINLASLP